MVSDYTIVIPTLDRPGNMKAMLAMFPTAIVVVNESNAHLFKHVVPAKQLVTHPDMRLIETRNWILNTIQTECVIQMNDDIKSLMAIAGHTKTYRDPKIIQAVIENTLQCSRDLGANVFCWSLTSNSSMLRPHIRPFRAAAPCSAHAFGVRGTARESRRLNVDFRGCGDFDYTLETLRTDRHLLCDVRWHFNCGGMSRGKGGQSGELKPAEQESGQQALRVKWGKYIGKSAAKQVSGKETWRSFSVNVQRTSPLGTH
jgi:hypothetical protein